MHLQSEPLFVLHLRGMDDNIDEMGQEALLQQILHTNSYHCKHQLWAGKHGLTCVSLTCATPCRAGPHFREPSREVIGFLPRKSDRRKARRCKM